MLNTYLGGDEFQFLSYWFDSSRIRTHVNKVNMSCKQIMSFDNKINKLRLLVRYQAWWPNREITRLIRDLTLKVPPPQEISLSEILHYEISSRKSPYLTRSHATRNRTARSHPESLFASRDLTPRDPALRDLILKVPPSHEISQAAHPTRSCTARSHTERPCVS